MSLKWLCAVAGVTAAVAGSYEGKSTTYTGNYALVFTLQGCYKRYSPDGEKYNFAGTFFNGCHLAHNMLAFKEL